MFFTIFWAVFFISIKLIALIILPVLYVLKVLLPKRNYHRIVYECASFWGRLVVQSTGSKLQISGMENIPDCRTLCIIANHQSFLDIPVLLGWLRIPLGFIAKMELLKVPVISHWMKELNCVFINRKNARSAMTSFNESAETIKSGNPIVIFPEGTRSKSPKMGQFHTGSLKLAYIAKASILPVSINGTYRIWEENYRIRKSIVKLTIHPVISPEDQIYQNKELLQEHLFNIIRSAND